MHSLTTAHTQHAAILSTHHSTEDRQSAYPSFPHSFLSLPVNSQLPSDHAMIAFGPSSMLHTSSLRHSTPGRWALRTLHLGTPHIPFGHSTSQHAALRAPAYQEEHFSSRLVCLQDHLGKNVLEVFHIFRHLLQSANNRCSFILLLRRLA